MSSNTSTLPARSAKSATASTATLRDDLQTLKADLDTLLGHAAELTDAELHDAQERILAKFNSLRVAAKGIAVEAGRQFNHGVEVTSDYVKEKPIKSISLAVGFGVLLGVIIGRK
ncbi:MAG: DUF883 domain-containing protein [Herminiimonas sp.]|jgi:ElaB/YqjD/DUF883 family membrane-anchored ribosome-binding protein|uniref:DUF883 family protein n=1 Tax=Herminiimonas sp. TaxID=1926289 RepID=UPI0027268724|nr:DUF883 domain-containing protein [Herminiimonas sp.]MDO9419949.1 DUF883 domain-containing protein [Herminiimonas sp.]